MVWQQWVLLGIFLWLLLAGVHANDKPSVRVGVAVIMVVMAALVVTI